MGKSDNKNYDTGVVVRLVINATLSCFLTGYNIGVTNSSLENVSKAVGWSGDYNTFSAICNGVFPGGAVIGSILSGKIANKYGRRKGMIYTALLCIISSGITIIPTVPTFVIGRFISGLVAAAGVTFPPMFINEVVPEDIRGKLGSLVQFQVTFGIFVAFLMCLMLPVYNFHLWTNDLWILVYAIPVVPSIIQLLLFWTVYKNDTPKWLNMVNRKKELEIVLRSIYTKDWETYMNKIQEEPENNEFKAENKSEPSFCQLFTIKKYRKPVIVGCALSMLQQLSGINMFIFYSSKIYQEIEKTKNYGAEFTAALGFFNMVTTMICLVFIEKYGRKILLIQGCIGMAICHLFLFLFNIISAIPSAASLPFMMIYVGFFESSLGPVLWIYCGETLTDRGVGLAVAVNWIFAAFIGSVFNFYVELVTIGFAFLTFSVICALGIVFIWAFILETKGKTRDEIVKLLGDN